MGVRGPESAVGTIRRVTSRPLRSARVAAVALLVGLAALLGPGLGTAGAHATLVDSRPGNDEMLDSAPRQVELVFDAAVSVKGGEVAVLGPGGERVDTGDPSSGDGARQVTQRVEGDEQGTYTVSYRVLSDDGHVISGSFVYHVGRRTGAATVDEGSQASRALEALGRWLSLSGALVAGGVVAMALLVDRSPGGWTGGLASSRRLLLPAGASVLFGSGLTLLGSAAELEGSLAGGFGGVGDVISSGRTGTVALLRVLVALALVVTVAGGALLRRVPWLAALCVVATLALPSFGGHAATVSPAALGVATDVVHLLSAAVWVGGLGVLVLTWDADGDRARRFSAVALVAAPLTVAAGALNGWLQTRSVDALTDTDFGRLVLAKAGGAAVLLAFGLIHRRWLADRARSVTGLVTGLRVELMVGVAVVAVTAVMLGTRPGVDEVPTPVQVVRQAGDTTVRLQVEPGRSGPNDVHLWYLGKDGSLVAVDAADLEISAPGIAPRRVPLRPITPNHSTASGVQLASGTWSFELTVVRGGVPSRTTFEVPIS